MARGREIAPFDLRHEANARAVIEAVLDAVRKPHPLMEPAQYVDHVLGTFGFGYGIEGFADVLAQRDRLAQALRLLRDTGGSEVTHNIATRALEEAGVSDPEDDSCG